MPLVVKDRVFENSTTTGTGTFTLSGAVTGYQTFSSAIGNGNTTYYTIANNTEWEVGIGTVGAGTLTRDTILESSNGGTAVNFSAGTKNVFCTYPAEKSVDIETAQTLTNKTISSANNTLNLDTAPAIGGTSANTGKFTTLNYTSALQNNGNAAYSVKGDFIVYDTGTNATYTPSSGVRAFLVEVIGGGGGGGGADGQGTGTNAAATAGGGGGYSSVFITNLSQTFKYTVGAAGGGGAAGANAGTDGGTSYFYGGASGTTVLAQATGGGGGGGATGTSGNASAIGVAGGVGSVGSINLAGGRSSSRATLSGLIACISISGAAPKIGGGKTASSTAGSGIAATNYGEGGGGANSFNVATNYAGGDGFSGAIIITEYY